MESIIQALFYLILIVVSLAITFRQWRKQRELVGNFTPVANAKEAKEVVNRMLAELNTGGEWIDDNQSHVVRFDYQGGHFSIEYTDERPFAHLSFLYFYDTTTDHIGVVRALANRCNLNADICHVCYSIEDGKAQVDAHMFSGFVLSHNTTAAQLMVYLNEIFLWRNMFVQRISEVIGDDETNTDQELDHAENAYQMALVRQHEFAVQPKNDDKRFKPGYEPRLADITQATLGLDSLHAIAAKVMRADGTIELLEGDAAESYDLASAIIADGEYLGATAVVLLSYQDERTPEARRELTITLQRNEKTDSTLFFRATFAVAPLAPTPERPITAPFNMQKWASVLLAFDTMPEGQQAAKFNYLWKEAVEARRNNSPRPSDKDIALLYDCDTNPAAYCIYRGMNYFHNRAFAQALPLLRHACEVQKIVVKTRANDEKEIRLLHEMCADVAICYSELGQPAEAVAYLEPTVAARRFSDLREYITNMLQANDPRAMNFINVMIEDAEDAMKRAAQDNDDDDEETGTDDSPFKDFYQFTLRMKARLMAQQGLFDKAERLLTPLITKDVYGDLAQNELNSVRQLRKEWEEREAKIMVEEAKKKIKEAQSKTEGNDNDNANPNK